MNKKIKDYFAQVLNQEEKEYKKNKKNKEQLANAKKDDWELGIGNIITINTTEKEQ